MLDGITALILTGCGLGIAKRIQVALGVKEAKRILIQQLDRNIELKKKEDN